jgi:hypothetical protein
MKNKTEEAYKDGEAMGIIIGGFIFAVAFLIFSVI